MTDTQRGTRRTIYLVAMVILLTQGMTMSELVPPEDALLATLVAATLFLLLYASTYADDWLERRRDAPGDDEVAA